MSKAEQLSRRKAKRKPKPTAGRRIVWNCLVRKMREEWRLTLREVSTGTGLSISVLSAVEHGTDPQLTTAWKLADFYGQTTRQLWPSLIGRHP